MYVGVVGGNKEEEMSSWSLGKKKNQEFYNSYLYLFLKVNVTSKRVKGLSNIKG